MSTRLKELYFAPKRWEMSGKLYEFFGIRFYKKWVPTGGEVQVRRSGEKYLKGRNMAAVLVFEQLTRKNEAAHVFLFLVYTGLGLLMSLLHVGFVLLFLILNILVNVYPIMLQRYNRARIYRMQQRYTPSV